MGMDLVELAITVEETFGIRISDEEAPEIITVGDLYACVLSKLPTEETKRCLSAATFYQFRRALTGQFRLDRRDIRPSTPIEQIIPKANRKVEWQRLAHILEWRLPTLVCPSWMTVMWFGSLLIVLITLVIVLMTLLITGWQNTLFRFDTVSGIASSILFAWFIGCLLFTVVIYHLTNTFADRFPSDSQTVGDLAKAALSMNYGDISRHEARWNRQEVWEALRTIIVEQLGVKPEEVKESAGFVKDFGAD